MTSITTSLASNALASATGVSTQQAESSIETKNRPEIIVCIGTVQTRKTAKYNTPVLASGNTDDIGIMFGFGSPLHRMAQKLYPASGNGSNVDTYFLPIEAPKTAAAEVQTIAVNAEKITKSFNGYIKLRDLPFEAAADIAGKVATIYQKNPAMSPRKTKLNSYETSYIPFTLIKDMGPVEIIQTLYDTLIEEISLPFIPSIQETESGVLTLTAKWPGSDSKFYIEIVNENDKPITAADYGVSFEIKTTTEAAGEGAIPDEALKVLDKEFGVTRVISQYSSTNVLNKLQEKFDSFRNPLIAQYVICYSSIEAPEHKTVKGTYDKEKLITLGTARRDDMVNVQIVGDYGNLRKLEYEERNQLLLAGFSNLVKEPDNDYILMDLVTFYHPVGKKNPLYRFDRDITVVANCSYRIMDKFENSEEWASAILVADGDITTNPKARKLKDIKAELNSIISGLGRDGFVADYVNAQKNTKVEIDKGNPNRININPNFNISGIARIFDVTNFVSFYLGS